MKLRRNQRCPIHNSFSCCGRESIWNRRKAGVGVERIEDQYHPRGYREVRSAAEMKKLLARKIIEQGLKCGICNQPFTDYEDIVPDRFGTCGAVFPLLQYRH